MNPDSPQRGHQTTDWPGKPFILGVLVHFCFAAMIFLIVAGLVSVWTHRTWPAAGSLPGPSTHPGWNTSAPQLQVQPGLDIEKMRQKEQGRLRAVRWTDDTHAFAAIPIDRAMELLVQPNGGVLLETPRAATPIDLQHQKAAAMAPHPAP